MIFNHFQFFSFVLILRKNLNTNKYILKKYILEYKIPSPQYENMKKKIEVKMNFILKYVHERISFHYQWNICVLQMTWMENHITRSRSTVRAISTLISCWLYLNQQSKWSYCSVQIWNYLKWSHDLETSVGSWFNKTCCLNIGHLCLFRITKKRVFNRTDK